VAAFLPTLEVIARWLAYLTRLQERVLRSSSKVQIHPVLSLLVFAGMAAVAYADHLVAGVSLAYLYFLPLALSAFVHRLRTSMVLVLICAFLGDWFGPAEHGQWPHAARMVLALIGFTSVVLFVNRLTAQRAALGRVVQDQADELAKEMELAAEVQRRLLPSYPPSVPGFELAARMYPAKAVGGDYYDFMEMPNGKLGFAIGDVSGKGVSAGLFMPAVRIALRANVGREARVEQTMEMANRVMYELTDEERFVSLFYGVLDITSRHLCYANAGHHPPLLFRAHSREADWLETGGPVLGLLSDVRFESGSTDLLSGDLFVLYTDGVVEAHNPDGKEFSRDRLLAVVAAHSEVSAEELTRTIYSSVVDFSRKDRLEDDLTVVVLKAVSNTSD
jgi:sigma-B regulation protein RsbU (phosphoserine phosphatase)